MIAFTTVCYVCVRARVYVCAGTHGLLGFEDYQALTCNKVTTQLRGRAEPMR